LATPRSILDLYNKTQPKKPEPYTVGLSVIKNNLINGVGSVYYLAQSNASNGGTGGQQVPLISYYAYVDGLDYYDIESGSTYYDVNIPPIQ